MKRCVDVDAAEIPFTANYCVRFYRLLFIVVVGSGDSGTYK